MRSAPCNRPRAMRGSTFVVILAVLFSLVLIAAFAGYGALRQLLTPQWAREHVVPRIEQALGRPVSFEELHVGLGELILTGVRLGESPEFQSEDDPNFAVVERVELGLDLTALRQLRIVVNRLELVRPYVRLHRLPDARWNVRAFAARIAEIRDEAVPSLRVKPDSAVGLSPPRRFSLDRLGELVETARERLLDVSTMLIRSVSISGGLLLVEDSAARRPGYARVSVRSIAIEAKQIRVDAPIEFSVDAEIVPDSDRVWTLRGAASYDVAENFLDVDVSFDEFDPDCIVSMLARPLSLPPKPLEPDRPKPFKLQADVEVDHLPYLIFDASAVTASVALKRRTLELREIRGRNSGGTITLTGLIRFEPAVAHHDLALKLEGARFEDGLGSVLPAPWNGIHGTHTVDLRAKFPVARGEPFVRALIGAGAKPDGSYLRGRLDLEAPVIDVDAMLRLAAMRAEARGITGDALPIDTGRIDADIALKVDRLRLRDIDFLDVRSRGSLRDSTVEITSLESEVERAGTASLSGSVVLDRPGFAYSCRLDIDGADQGVLLRSIAQPNWGEPSGRTDVRLTLAGAGTTGDTALANLRAELDVRVHDGRIHDADLLESIADETGIEGFRDMRLVESGGTITVADSIVSTRNLRLASRDARILLKGQLGFDRSLDLKVKLGIGPDSQRRLLSRGLLLPYKEDDDGWTNIPLTVAGSFSDPEITIDSAIVASTAINALPDATKRLGRGGAGVARKITDTAADAMPKAAGDLLRGAESATEQVIGGTYGSLEAIVKGLARVLTGNARPRDESAQQEAEGPPPEGSSIDKLTDSVGQSVEQKVQGGAVP